MGTKIAAGVIVRFSWPLSCTLKFAGLKVANVDADRLAEVMVQAIHMS